MGCAATGIGVDGADVFGVASEGRVAGAWGVGTAFFGSSKEGSVVVSGARVGVGSGSVSGKGAQAKRQGMASKQVQTNAGLRGAMAFIPDAAVQNIPIRNPECPEKGANVGKIARDLARNLGSCALLLPLGELLQGRLVVSFVFRRNKVNKEFAVQVIHFVLNATG